MNRLLSADDHQLILKIHNFKYNKMKDIIRYAYYVICALNLYEINDSPNLALRKCIFNKISNFLCKENVS